MLFCAILELFFVRSGYMHLNLSPLRSSGALSIARSSITSIDTNVTFYTDISKDSIKTSYSSRRDYAFPPPLSRLLIGLYV